MTYTQTHIILCILYRYSTSAASEEVNCQPFVVHTAHGELAVAHNGELVNCSSLRKMVRERDIVLQAMSRGRSEVSCRWLCTFDFKILFVLLLIILFSS